VGLAYRSVSVQEHPIHPEYSLDRQPLESPPDIIAAGHHNIRGASYFDASLTEELIHAERADDGKLVAMRLHGMAEEPKASSRTLPHWS